MVIITLETERSSEKGEEQCHRDLFNSFVSFQGKFRKQQNPKIKLSYIRRSEESCKKMLIIKPRTCEWKCKCDDINAVLMWKLGEHVITIEQRKYLSREVH